MSEPQPISEFGKAYQALIAQIADAEDSNEKHMLKEKLKALIIANAVPPRPRR